ncbi:hypothetical protein AB1Y20_019343 [Prymnesium parvum]|uniref:Metallo-beta-lactamase domain-containing protein n=1 Tax=Prymnesium parvum TaxID=97485 RepID=A0AB34JQW4_PRYPA
MAEFVDVEGSESAWLAAEGMCEEDEEFQISQSWACALEEDLHLPPYVLPPTPWLHVDDAGAHSTAPFSPASSGLMTPAPAPFTPMLPTHAPSAPEQTPHAPSTRAPLTTLPITPLRSAPEATPPARAGPVLPAPVPSPAEPVDGAPPRDALRLLMASARNAWKPPNAFEVMMKASTPATAPVDTPRGRGGGRGKGRREGLAASAGRRRGGGRAYLAPHKRVEGTRLVVDGFTAPPVESLLYFLTHFHSDHYTGLTSKWSVPLYCSTVTARLVTRQLGVSPHVLRILTLGQTTVLPSGDRVTPVDANHCPGAVILLFELQDGRCVLHTGDFRYLPSMAQHPALAGKKIDLLYLDTTYCNPQYAFPSQAAAVDEVVMHCKLLLPANRTLVLFGAYSIGKERVYLQVARELGVHIYVDRARWRTLECIGLDPMDIPWLTTQD